MARMKMRKETWKLGRLEAWNEPFVGYQETV